MNDMSSVIVPKSDQINADDFIAGPQVITIRDVQIRGGQEQPVSIYFEGSDKAYRPCKSMSRVLVQAWGPDAKRYIGRSLTLYRDPAVKWGGMEVGGIRISHMTDIDGKMVMQLTATKGQRKPHVVMPLVDAPKQTARQTPQQWAAAHKDAIDAAATTDDLDAVEAAGKRALAKLETEHPDLHAELTHAYSVRRSALAQDGPADEDRGEGFNGADGDGFAGFGEGGE